MIVRNHRLCRDDETGYEYVESPNYYDMDFRPSLLVMHYTAGTNSLPWLTTPSSKVSAHLLISRCGLIIQMVPFNRPAWHCGSAARWKGMTNLNVHSLGIEMENLGRLERIGGKWTAMNGVEVKDDQVIVAKHRLDPKPTGWHRYTPEQTEVARLARDAMVRAYGLEVVGHEDILPTKRDPGPAWEA